MPAPDGRPTDRAGRTDRRELVLGSGSAARLRLLREAGLRPAVIVSGVDEDVDAVDTPSAVMALAERKGRAIVDRCPDALVIACDSLLDLDGRRIGKPSDPKEAVELWRRLSGRSASLHTGHWLTDTRTGSVAVDMARSTVRFATLSEAEVRAYVATGEPLGAAGGFTIDGYGSAFVESIDGSSSNVLGLSMPLFRRMLLRLGIDITQLWWP
ncbi:MAG TPA: nucleoside triphosphate pyrophosphatase [Acidimicrobiales bacterium]|jgi:septum formation protein